MSMAPQVVRVFEVGDYEQEIARAVALLREGAVIVLPTETLYGAAGVLSNDNALTGLKAIRAGAGGGDAKPFTIHLARREQAMRYLGDVSEMGVRLMKKLWPGPVG